MDELGIAAKDVPVDQFIPLGRMLYKAPSDGKWGEHEREATWSLLLVQVIFLQMVLLNNFFPSLQSIICYS